VEEQAEAEPLTPSAPLPSPDSPTLGAAASPPHTPVTPSTFSSMDVGGSECVVCMERGVRTTWTDGLNHSYGHR